MNTTEVLESLRTFVKEEHEANFSKLSEVWSKPLSKKLKTGESQAISSIEIEDKGRLLVTLDNNDSRFREGDMICIHHGDAIKESFIRNATIELENDGDWLIKAEFDIGLIKSTKGPFYADADCMDLKPFFEKALDEVASIQNGRDIVLPLLAGELDTEFLFIDNYDDAADIAEDNGLNEKQIDAVGKGVATQYLTCIQGPPGTGKTKVISLIAKILVNEGQNVFLTSHTHMAINNALNKISKENVPTIKVGASSTVKGLDSSIPRFDHWDDWEERPESGCVIGATPFATCSARLETFEFDTVIFDEASQITVPLALMAMRKARRFIFVGDHKQLPPVVISKSVLDKSCYSVFSKLVQENPSVSVLLNQTYRMNSDLSSWPSQQYYQGQLQSVGSNANRTLSLKTEPEKYKPIFARENSFVYLKSPGLNTRTYSIEEAELVTKLIEIATDSGVMLSDIGVVTPYRNHAKTIRNLLTEKFGIFKAKDVVTDTVERMQGQEREMVIVSLCSSDKQFIKAVANFFFQPERLNVAITRPMVKLILIGPELSEEFKVDPKHETLQSNINAYRSLVNSAHKVMVEGV